MLAFPLLTSIFPLSRWMYVCTLVSIHTCTYVCWSDWKLFSFKVYLHFSCKRPYSFQETLQVIGDSERVITDISQGLPFLFSYSYYLLLGCHFPLGLDACDSSIVACLLSGSLSSRPYIQTVSH